MDEGVPQIIQQRWKSLFGVWEWFYRNLVIIDRLNTLPQYAPDSCDEPFDIGVRVVIPLLVASMGAQVLSAAPPDSVTGPPPIAVDTHVINDASSPVPVTGDVNANVAGSVDVLGEVDVISVPDSLTDQIDRLIEKVEELADAEENTRPAPATWIRSLSLNASSSDMTTQTPFEEALSYSLAPLSYPRRTIREFSILVVQLIILIVAMSVLAKVTRNFHRR